MGIQKTAGHTRRSIGVPDRCREIGLFREGPVEHHRCAEDARGICQMIDRMKISPFSLEPCFPDTASPARTDDKVTVMDTRNDLMIESLSVEAPKQGGNMFAGLVRQFQRPFRCCEIPEADGIGPGSFLLDEVEEIVGIEEIVRVPDIVDPPVDALPADGELPGFP